MYSCNVGAEAEAGGRAPTKSFMTLRHDLAALPWVLARPCDIVLAPPQRPAFLEALRAAGVREICEFHPTPPVGRAIAAHRPYASVGEHLRRSNVAKYRVDVVVCQSLLEVREAVVQLGPKVVLKAEYSSSGLGVRVCEGSAALDGGADAERWASNCLQRDGVLTVEPWYEILAEFTGEWLDGEWYGVSQPIVENMRWTGQWLGEPSERYDAEIVDFVFGRREIETTLAALNVPATCGTGTCGMDVAIVRGAGGDLQVQVMELNARTTLSHYALAAKLRVPNALRFDVLRVSEAEARNDIVYLTDPHTAKVFVAVVAVTTGTGVAGGGATPT